MSGSDPDVGGLLKVSTDDGLNLRLVEIFAAVWTLGFSLPVFFAVPEIPASTRREKVGFFRSYVVLVKDVGALWKSDRNTVKFLIASAIFRDGLTGVFTFGAIIARGSFGFSAGEVLYFGIAANVVAGVSTILVGRLDDRLGPRTVMLTALIGLVVAGLGVFFLHDEGQIVFWGRRAHPVPLRRPRAVREPQLPHPRDPAAPPGGGLRAVRDQRPRGILHRAAHVQPLHRDLRGAVLGQCSASSW